MINISNKARKILYDLIIHKDSSSALLYLKGGGCNGFSYKFKILEKSENLINYKNNEKINLCNSKNINLYLCNKSLMFLIGTNIDYIEDIMGSRFDFKNNNIESKCGCGTSFNFK